MIQIDCYSAMADIGLRSWAVLILCLMAGAALGFTIPV